MIRSIVELIRGIVLKSYERCYTNMEYQGYAAMGCCGGVVGGTAVTEYLSEKCVNCPHWVALERK